MSRTSKTFAVGMLSAALALAVQAAAGQPASLRNANDATRVVRGNANALTDPSSAGGSAVVAAWLRGKGLGSAANAMRTVSD